MSALDRPGEFGALFAVALFGGALLLVWILASELWNRRK